jgi:predicted glycosyltransferase/predicted transcriptional regulator
LTERTKIRKIWVAMSTPFQANFFAPLIRELRSEYEFLVTAREHDRISAILDEKGIQYMTVGRHGGRDLTNKLEAYASNIQELVPVIQREKPDLLLTERWPEAVRVAFGYNIPAWTLFFDEREKHVNQMVFPLASKIFAPRFYTFQELYQNGVTDPEKVVLFNGFHTCYLKDEKVEDAVPYKNLGLHGPVVFVRPEPAFASFFPSHQPILENAVQLVLKKGSTNVVVLPRTEEQRATYAKMGATILDHPMRGNPVAYADVTLGAAETMLMEAFILGKPAVSSIYWSPSKPVIELHRYIHHSVEPTLVANYVERFLDDEEERKAFQEKAALLVRNMDNPVRLMIDQIKEMDRGETLQVAARRRSQMEIYLDILQSVSLRPLRPTHIMRNANISYNELKKIIDTLEKKGLISVEGTIGGRFYQATEDGLRLVESYRGIRQRLFH